MSNVLLCPSEHVSLHFSSLQYFHCSHVSLDCAIWELPEGLKGVKFDTFVKAFAGIHPSSLVVLHTGSKGLVEWVDTRRKCVAVYDMGMSTFKELSISSVKSIGSIIGPQLQG